MEDVKSWTVSGGLDVGSHFRCAFRPCQHEDGFFAEMRFIPRWRATHDVSDYRTILSLGMTADPPRFRSLSPLECLQTQGAAWSSRSRGDLSTRPTRHSPEVASSKRRSKRSASARKACSASGPSASMHSSVPCTATSVKTPKILFPSTRSPSRITSMRDWNLLAVLTNKSAGRACSPCSLSTVTRQDRTPWSMIMPTACYPSCLSVRPGPGPSHRPAGQSRLPRLE